MPVQRAGEYDYVGFLEQRGEEYRRALGVYFAYWKADGIVRADTNHNPYPAGVPILRTTRTAPPRNSPMPFRMR